MKAKLLLLCLISSTALWANLFRPASKLYKFETQHFDIIFTKDIEHEARYAASFADVMFENITNALGVSYDRRIPVVLTADEDSANGYSVSSPHNYFSVFLGTVPLGSSIVNFEDLFYSIFLHEMVHAVSLNSRSKVWQILNAPLRGYLAPTLWTTQLNFVEGVTVNFESRRGFTNESRAAFMREFMGSSKFGRVNDPDVRSQLIQDSIEGDFLSWDRSGGSLDKMPYADAYYFYGGYFNHYILDKYGSAKYKELWQEFGEGNVFMLTPFLYKSVYGVSYFDEWKAFELHLRKDASFEYNHSVVREKREFYRSPVRHGDKLYYISGVDANLKSYSLRSGKTERLSASSSLMRGGYLDISSDGSKLLLTQRFMDGGFSKYVSREFDIEERRFSGKSYEGFTEAAFFKDGVLGVRSRKQYSDLVYINGKGKENVLIKGGMRTAFGSPRALNEKQAVLIMKNGDYNKPVIYDFQSNKLYEIETKTEGLNAYAKSLIVEDGVIRYAFNPGGGLYKSAYIKEGRLFAQKRAYSGGSYESFNLDGRVYYIAHFARHHKIMKMPDNAYEERNEGFSLKGLSLAEDPGFNYEGKMQKYSRFAGLLRSFAWYPTTAEFVGAFRDMDLRSVGMSAIFVDPTEAHDLYFSFAYDFAETFFHYSVDYFNNSFKPLSFVVNVRDFYNEGLNESDYRSSFAGLSMLLGLNPGYSAANLNLGLNASYYSHTEHIDESVSIYKHGSSSSFIVGTSLSFGKSVSELRPLFYKSFGLNLSYDYNINEGLNKTEASASISPPRIPMTSSVYVAFSPDNEEGLGFSANSENFVFNYPAYREFSSITNTDAFYLFSDTKLNSPGLEIQHQLFPLPFYIRRFFISGGYRNAVLKGQYYHSIYARLNMDFAIPVGMISRFDMPTIFVEGNYGFNNERASVYFSLEHLF